MRRLGEIDWDFPSQQSESAFSSLHWHPCRFPSQIPAITIARLTEPGARILDPFMGSATTLVEAQRLSRSSLGIDLNPVSALMASAKTLQIDAKGVDRMTKQIELRILKDWTDISIANAPPQVQSQKWYTPKTFIALSKLFEVIGSLDGHQKLLAKAAFSSILLQACRETRHWGYVCDNTTPKSERDADARALFINAMRRYSAAYKERDRFAGPEFKEARVAQGDARQVLSGIASESFDAFVTSPPYFGVADYVKAQRLSMEWFEFELEPLRKLEIGARSKRHRKNGASAYGRELTAVFQECHRTLRKGKFGVIVFGQSPKREDCEEPFIDQLREIGFTIELRQKRQIPNTRRLNPSLLDESVIVVRR
ncbi:DNA methyltransferase [Citromicrobium bathyomarinum]